MKNKIDISKWKEYNIIDLFQIKLSSDDLQPGKLVDGEIPLVSSGKTNNGIVMYIEEQKEAKLYNENTITIDMFGKAFYQPQRYYAVSHGRVNILIPKYKITKNIGMFLVSVFEKSFEEKYSFTTMCSSTLLKSEKIKLPSNNNGTPDWEFMEKYMENIKTQVNKSLSGLNNCIEERNKIDISKWREFHLYDIFDIDSGSKMDKIAMKFDNPTINFVGRSGINNGVTAVVDEVEDYAPYKAGNLTLALGGAYLGSCFVQEKDFYTSQNVVVLIPKENISFYAKEFICAVIFKEGNTHYKAFIDELNRHIKTDFIIKLPVDSYGKPNYEYMDKYMIELLNKAKNKISCLNGI